ncbi:MAG: UvrD-helicase domain-containing protein [Vampirovibrionales bacterium]
MLSYALTHPSSQPHTVGLEVLEQCLETLVPDYFNEAQKQAILTPISQGLKLLAGAGAGKTAVLTRRYVYGLLTLAKQAVLSQDSVQEDASSQGVDWESLPQQQLMITFTDKAAQEMRERVKHLWEETLQLPPLRLTSDTLGTIHAFCGGVLRQALPLHPGTLTEPLELPDLGLLGRYPLPTRHYQLVDDIAKRDLLLQLKRHWHYGIPKTELLQLFDTWGLELPELRTWLHTCPSEKISHFHLRQFLPAHQPKRLLAQLDKLLATLKTLAMTPQGVFHTLHHQQTHLLEAILKLQVPRHTLNPDELEPLLQEELIALWQNSQSLAPYQSLGLEPLQALEEEDDLKKRLKQWDGFFKTEFLASITLLEKRKQRKKAYMYTPSPYQPFYTAFMTTQLKRLLELACCFYAQYQSLLLSKNLCDFDDLILLSTVLLYATPALRQRLQQQYKLMLVDEFQDTNLAQIRLLQALLPEATAESPLPLPRLTVVGDLRQAIYGFRHAKPNNLTLIFSKHAHVTQTLDANYRSQAPMVEAANTLMAEGPLGQVMPALRHPMLAKAPASTPHVLSQKASERCHVHWVSNETVKGASLDTAWQEELEVTLRYIRALLQKNVPPDAIAIIAHHHTKLGRMAYALEQAGIPFKRQKEKDFFTRPLTQQCLTWCALLYQPSDTAAWWHVLSRVVPSTTLQHALRQALLTPHQPCFMWLQDALACLSLTDQDTTACQGYPCHEALFPWLAQSYQALMQTRRALQAHVTPLEFPARVLSLFSMFQPALSTEPSSEDARWYHAMHTVLAQQWQATLQECPMPKMGWTEDTFACACQRLLARLHVMVEAQTTPTQDSGLSEASDTSPDALLVEMTLPEDVPGVELLTIHSSKGLEYPYVILPWVESRATLRKTSLKDSAWVVDVQEDGLPGFGLFPKHWFSTDHPCYTVWSQLWQRPELELESIRLFYVALTRAKEGILWMGLPKTTPSWMKQCLEAWHPCPV